MRERLLLQLFFYFKFSQPEQKRNKNFCAEIFIKLFLKQITQWGLIIPCQCVITVVSFYQTG